MRKKRKGCCLLFPLALFLADCLCGCAPEIYFEPCEPDPFATATLFVKRGDMDKAISQLRPLLEKSPYQCQAAFYLFTLDAGRREYRDVLLTDFCKDNSPAHARLVEQLVDFQEELKKCGASLRKQKSRAEAAEKQCAVLDEEISRLRFEMEKLEEIRKETEKWRLK
jgi:hypothetical protein